MLVLKREKNQTIVVDGPCVITIGELGTRHVKVLVDAPQTTKILRGELLPEDGKRESGTTAKKE